MNNSLVTTKDEYTKEDVTNGSGIITKMIGSLKEYQRVVAIGPLVRNISVGDLVCINPKRYAIKKHENGSLKDGVITDNPVVAYNFNVIELDHKPHLLLYDSDIDFVITDFDEDDKPSDNKLIIPKKKVIV